MICKLRDSWCRMINFGSNFDKGKYLWKYYLIKSLDSDSFGYLPLNSRINSILDGLWSTCLFRRWSDDLNCIWHRHDFSCVTIFPMFERNEVNVSLVQIDLRTVTQSVNEKRYLHSYTTCTTIMNHLLSDHTFLDLPRKGGNPRLRWVEILHLNRSPWNYFKMMKKLFFWNTWYHWYVSALTVSQGPQYPLSAVWGGIRWTIRLQCCLQNESCRGGGEAKDLTEKQKLDNIKICWLDHESWITRQTAWQCN